MSHCSGDQSNPSAQGSVAAFYPDTRETLTVPDLQDGKASEIILPFGFRSERGLRHKSNQIQYDWATIVLEAIRGSLLGRNYSVSMLYFEFANSGNTPVVVPTGFSRAEGLDYYAGLENTEDRDYLRVPIVAANLETTDSTNYPKGNRLTYWGITSGMSGVHGKEFSADAGSRLYGAALVASPVVDNPSEDLIFSRFYFSEADEQLRKIDGSHLGLAWPVRLS